MEGQTDVLHINLIGGLVTRNPSKNKTRLKYSICFYCYYRALNRIINLGYNLQLTVVTQKQLWKDLQSTGMRVQATYFVTFFHHVMVYMQ